jgi:hypothetical protein
MNCHDNNVNARRGSQEVKTFFRPGGALDVAHPAFES